MLSFQSGPPYTLASAYPDAGPPAGEGAASYLMLSWCALGWIVITWMTILTILVAMIGVKYPADVDTLSSEDLEFMDDAFTRLSNITAGVDESLEYFEDNEACIEGLCGPNSTVEPRIFDSVRDRGCWDAATNTPTLFSGVGTPGDLYLVCTAGNTTIDGTSSWEANDLLLFTEDTTNGDRWVPYAPRGATLVDNGGGDQPILLNGTANPYLVKQIADGSTGKITIDDSDPANLVIALTALGTTEQIRTYPTLTGATTVLGWSNLGGTPTLVSEQWIRRGDLLQGTFVVVAELDAPEPHILKLGTFPSEILAEIGGPAGSPTTLTGTSAWCDGHRTFSAAGNDDYLYLLRGCHLNVGGTTTDTVSVTLEGDVRDIGAGVTSHVRLAFTVVLDALGAFALP